jgi:hypothetical protein
MFHGIISISMICSSSILMPLAQMLTSRADYLPVYFQVCLGASPIRSAIDVLPTALVIAPWAFIAGTIVQTTNKYRPVNALGWVCTIIGFGLLSMLRADSCVGKWVSFQFISSAGIGILVRPVLPLYVHHADAGSGM